MKGLSHGLGIHGNGIAQHIGFKKYERNVENDIIENGCKKWHIFRLRYRTTV